MNSMRVRVIRHSFPLVLFLLAGCGGGAVLLPSTVGKTSEKGLANFDTVDTGPRAIYRGAQPSQDGFATLRDVYHVKTIIDLRDDVMPWERKTVEKGGMVYCHIPSAATEEAGTQAKHIREFLQAVEKLPRPIFVHCKMGRDRTGLQVAAYRIVTGQMTADEARAELKAHGYNQFWFPGIDHFLQTMKAAEFKLVTSANAALGE